MSLVTRASLAFLVSCAMVAGCQSASAPTTSTTSTTSTASTPAVGPSVPPSAAPVAIGAYERRVLADGATALWPLATVASGSTPALGRSAGTAAVLTGTAPHTTVGPTLNRTRRTALAFRGSGRFVTTLTRGLDEQQPAWTLEMWVRNDGCSSSGYERLAATGSRSAQGRQGLDLLHYPRSGERPCGYGAEYYRNGVFQGGCGAHATARGAWTHLAVTYVHAAGASRGTLRCYLDGAPVGMGVVRDVGPGVDTPLGLGGAGNGLERGLTTAALTEVAYYPEVLTAAVLARHAAAA